MTTEAGLNLEQIARREALWKRGAEIVKNSPQHMIDVDAEYDGANVLAIVAITPTGEAFYSELRPITLDFAPANLQFCEEHGLPRERLLREAPDAGSVMLEFSDWLTIQSKTSGKPLVFSAFNAAFDFPLIESYFKHAGIEENPFGIAPFDLKSLAMVFSPDWDWDMTKKRNLSRIIIPDGDFTHNALEDAKYQQLIHFGMAALLEERQLLA